MSNQKDLTLKQNVEAELEWNPEVDASRIGIAAEGGVITLTGKAAKLDTSVAGSGGVDAFAFEVATASASIAGSGFAHVNAATSTTASIMGSGKVVYAGAAKVTKSIRGSGTVEPKDKPKQSASSGW